MRFAIALFCCAAALAGCRSRPIEGTWESSDGRSRIELRPDQTASGTMPAGPITAAFNAKFEYDGSVLTLKDVDVPMLNLAPDEARQLADAAMPAVIDHQVRWKDRDTIVLSGGAFLNGEFKRRD